MIHDVVVCCCHHYDLAQFLKHIMRLQVLVSITMSDCDCYGPGPLRRTWICHNSPTTLWFCGPCGSFDCFAFCNLADAAPAFHGAPLNQGEPLLVYMVCVFHPVTFFIKTDDFDSGDSADPVVFRLPFCFQLVLRTGRVIENGEFAFNTRSCWQQHAASMVAAFS